MLNPLSKFQPARLHWIGADLVLAAITSHLAANRLPHGKTPANLYVACMLGAVVFSAYIIDQLLSSKPGQITDEDRFFKKYRSLFFKIIPFTLVLAGILSFFAPATLWVFGTGMVIVTSFYLWVSARSSPGGARQYLRTPLISLIFFCGVWASTWFYGNEISTESVILGCIFYLIILQNLLLTAHYEAMKNPRIPNFATWFGKIKSHRTTRNFTILIALAGIGFCLWTDLRYAQRLSVILVIMSLAHLLILLKLPQLRSKSYTGLLIRLLLAIPLLVL